MGDQDSTRRSPSNALPLSELLDDPELWTWFSRDNRPRWLAAEACDGRLSIGVVSRPSSWTVDAATGRKPGRGADTAKKRPTRLLTGDSPLGEDPLGDLLRFSPLRSGTLRRCRDCPASMGCFGAATGPPHRLAQVVLLLDLGDGGSHVYVDVCV